MNRIFDDTYKHKGWRNALIKLLEDEGITDKAVLAAMNEIPRHFLIEPVFEQAAYQNIAFPIAAEQTLSHPYTVAFQSQLLQIKKMDKVLEVGTGSGYQTAVLAKLGAMVFSVERQEQLYKQVTDKGFPLAKMMHFVKFFYGDGFEGLPTYAPFNKIIITCAAPYAPDALLQQLKPGGIMVIPITDKDGAMETMTRITKQHDGILIKEQFNKFSFVPMLPGKGNL